MKELKAEYQLSAPVFMAGLNPLVKGDHLRPPAIKGALRFWWRALNWGRIRTNTTSDNQALQQLHSEEADLFGSIAGQMGKQAKVLLRTNCDLDDPNPKINDFRAGAKLPQGLAYLCGQGLYSFKEGLKSNGLTGRCFVRCLWRADQLSVTQAQQLEQALLALGLLGSVGSRARKGFGSLSIHSLTGNAATAKVPENITELQEWITSARQASLTTDEPPFTAWSAHTRCWHLPLKNKGTLINQPIPLLQEYGNQMMLYRLSDKFSINGIAGKNLFADDAAQAYKILVGNKPEKAPRRAVFGLPNNVFFADEKQTVEIKPTAHERRASPLLAHVHCFPNGIMAMIATLFPARFLPDHDSIQFKNKNNKHSLPFTPNWSVIHKFIQQCDGQELTI